MPTATTTTTITGSSPHTIHKPTKVSSSLSTTLNTLIDRAGRAFVNHDLQLSQSLVDSAFTLLYPPLSLPDALNDNRKTWDIFRITLEAHVYASPPAAEDVPEHLKEIMLQSPHALMTRMYQRSLTLFTPASGSSKSVAMANVVYIPPSVINTLVYASLKVNCSDVGRVIIEEWLAHRHGRLSTIHTHYDAYKKILAIYCLQILPALEQWDYAKEFLDYESELSPRSREYLQSSLARLCIQAQAVRQPPSSLPDPPPSSSFSSTSPSPSSDRSFSPAPSSSSSSSSLSTTSTHTVVPSTSKGLHVAQSMTSITTLPSASQSTTSVSSDGTARLARSDRPSSSLSDRKQKTQRETMIRRTLSPVTSVITHPVVPSTEIRSPTTFALMKAYVASILNSTKLTTFLILAVIFPLISMMLRFRRRRRLTADGTVNTADMVRKRLQAVNGREAGVLGKAWSEIARVLMDTIRMGGSGLV
ncbi:uncharacterized protein BT62DRAFT_1071880 [Guyanagaster necrorhizus]|uniref:Uncharacterized protein n=1 Tax=Guyanagaster necrorhizus TaxID=856835 RepID=A0A9P7W3I3_9AGAR|nr:uncharacterized protein BT62DRAFT_1071880 [Guyanagaster necrorhizus MCA 3950]KAG7451305.1 hypothetical protein BT62DRAFT_1071880 [Guyanagaster necrorhizus MCA 3950]